MTPPVPPSSPGRGTFHRLRVAAVEPVAEDAVTVTLEVPPRLEQRFRFEAGQHLTLRVELEGEEVRRTYSICVGAGSPQLRIGVRRLPGGVLSGYVHDRLRPGDSLDVMEPAGEFTLDFDPRARRDYAAVAAGSGITPVLSLLATALEREPESRALLLYGNRSLSSTMFLDELMELKNRHRDRFELVPTFSREAQAAALNEGRIDAAKVQLLCQRLLDPGAVDAWLLCGPLPMLLQVRGALAELGVPAERQRTELFFVEDTPPERSRELEAALARPGEAEVVAKLNGRVTSFTMSRGEKIVDALAAIRPDAPYSCKGGVCATCRARLVEGEVTMDHTYALESMGHRPDLVLTCQAHPISDRVVVDYDG